MKQITKDIMRTAVTVHPSACPLTKEMRLHVGPGASINARAAMTIKGGLHLQDAHDPAVFHLIDEDTITGITVAIEPIKAKAAKVTNIAELIAWAERQPKEKAA